LGHLGLLRRGGWRWEERREYAAVCSKLASLLATLGRYAHAERLCTNALTEYQHKPSLFGTFPNLEIEPDGGRQKPAVAKLQTQLAQVRAICSKP